ncbi:unnamed protein product [Trichobilharzia regenti]|nr:unnamed protein product [Trichobilharzia regenti]
MCDDNGAVKKSIVVTDKPMLNSVTEEIDQIDDGKLNICDNDHDELRRMPTTAKLNKGSVQLERDVGLNADAVPEGLDTCETVSVIDQRVAHLSSDDSAKP